MAKVNFGWLKDKDGFRFAPKTFISKVIDKKGKSLEKILDEMKSNGSVPKPFLVYQNGLIIGDILRLKDIKVFTEDYPLASVLDEYDIILEFIYRSSNYNGWYRLMHYELKHNDLGDYKDSSYCVLVPVNHDGFEYISFNPAYGEILFSGASNCIRNLKIYLRKK